MTHARRARFRFEGIEVDSVLRELRRGPERIPLAPKPFELLLLLVINRHRSVSRVEIFEPPSWVSGKVISSAWLTG